MNRKEEMERLATKYEEMAAEAKTEAMRLEWGTVAAALRASAAPEEGFEPIPLADHDAIGRAVLNQPWEIQKAIVTITAHCTALVDECPTGKVADIAGCISRRCEELVAALPSDSGKAAPVDMILARNYATSAMNVCIALADEVVCRNGTAEDVAKSLRIRAALAPATEGGGREPSIWLLAGRLAGAELNYRNAYEQLGGSHMETGRAWDKLRQAGNAIREISDSVWEAALSPSPSVGTGTQPHSSADRKVGA